ncbi:MAG: 3-hydroxyacyl-CoA dehydrogenase family protein [Isosphaeraceae bacterium]
MIVEDVRRVLIVGAGTMGPGIAQVYALRGIHVDLVDTQPSALDSARERITSGLRSLAGMGAITTEAAATAGGLIELSGDLENAARQADVITEAITEQPAAKQALFGELDRLARRDTVFASNTSGLDIFSLLADIVPNRLDRLVIHHYFLPPTIVPLVEVVGGPQTRPEILDFSVALLKHLGSEPVVVKKFCPNFIVNSFQVALSATAARLLAEGIASPADIDRAVKHSLGIRLPIVGVVQTLDFTGLELIARILRHSGLDASYFEKLVAEGRQGVRSGRGLYDYSGRSQTEIESDRDRKYGLNRRNLEDIGAFDPV